MLTAISLSLETTFLLTIILVGEGNGEKDFLLIGPDKVQALFYSIGD